VRAGSHYTQLLAYDFDGQGTYLLFVDLGDGVQRSVLVSLKN
jgi:hypothetical protein